MHLTPRKRIEVFTDTQIVALRDDQANTTVHLTNNGNTIETIRAGTPAGSSASKSTLIVFGIYGIIKLQNQNYIVAVTKVEYAAAIAERNVYLATEFKFVGLKCKEASEDADAITIFQNIFSKRAFYFSPDYDLTNPFKRAAENKFKRGNYDSRFFYNEIYTTQLKEHGLDNWIQPFISGLVLEKIMVVNQKKIKFILLTRRDKSRAGYRFLSRGANEHGHTSNFAETEQILAVHEDNHTEMFSYLEIRGSIPLIWRQPPTMKWSPSLLIEQNDLKNQAAYDNHIKSLKKHYDEIHLVNLIDKKGSQKRIGEQFTKIVREHNDTKVKYTWFDFHAETKTGWDNLSKLIGDVRDSILSLGYSHFKVHKTVEKLFTQNDESEVPRITEVQLQKGVFRVNCMDSLDRTNVVMSLIARSILHSQLHAAGCILKPNGMAFEEFPRDLEVIFRDYWTENANRISMLYTGTGALKVEFTRTGKVTTSGKLDDGKKAITRYFLNNFYDPSHQNELDFFLGKLSYQDIAEAHHVSPTSVISNSAAMFLGPYFLSSILLSAAGKTFNWTFFFLLMGLSSFMSYSYVTMNAKKIWQEQLLR